jgi:hypothetical protein
MFLSKDYLGSKLLGTRLIPLKADHILSTQMEVFYMVSLEPNNVSSIVLQVSNTILKK